MKKLLVLSFLVLSIGSTFASEVEGKDDCSDLNQSKSVKSESGTEVKKPIGVQSVEG